MARHQYKDGNSSPKSLNKMFRIYFRAGIHPTSLPQEECRSFPLIYPHKVNYRRVGAIFSLGGGKTIDSSDESWGV